MLLDKETILSDDQDFAGVGPASTLSDKSYDQGAAGTPVIASAALPNDLGRGNPVQAFAQVTTAFTSGGAPTMVAQVVIADDQALTTNLLVLVETAAIALATLVVGYQFRLGTIPPGAGQRYIGLRYVTAVAAWTAGKIRAGLTWGRHTNLGFV